MTDAKPKEHLGVEADAIAADKLVKDILTGKHRLTPLHKLLQIFERR